MEILRSRIAKAALAAGLGAATLRSGIINGPSISEAVVSARMEKTIWCADETVPDVTGYKGRHPVYEFQDFAVTCLPLDEGVEPSAPTTALSEAPEGSHSYHVTVDVTHQQGGGWDGDGDQDPYFAEGPTDNERAELTLRPTDIRTITAVHIEGNGFDITEAGPSY